jgi:hypothetical protein
MKRIAVLAALAVLPCLSALSYAQADKPAAKPADKPAAAAPAPAPATKAAAAPAAKTADKPAAAAATKPTGKPAAAPAAKAAARKGGHSRDTRDARACLKLATNTEIIKCAEKYR